MRHVLIVGLALLVAPVFADEKVLVSAFRVTPVSASALGSEAADLMATSLPAGHTAVTKTLVSQELSLRSWSEPLTSTQMVSLTRALRASHFIRGAILITFPKARVKTARIEVGFEMVDANDESILGGFAADPVEFKLPADATQQQELVSQTLREVITKSAPRLTRANLATGKVLLTEQTGDVHLNIGHRHGLRKGMVLTATRKVYDDASKTTRNARIGELIVSETTEFSAIARPTTKGVVAQSLDTVTQTFELKASKEMLALLRS